VDTDAVRERAVASERGFVARNHRFLAANRNASRSGDGPAFARSGAPEAHPTSKRWVYRTLIPDADVIFGMASDERSPTLDDEGEMLPDEAAAIAERVDSLDEIDDEELLTTDEVAEKLGINLDE